MNFQRYKIALARILLPILTIWLAVMPAKSYAIVPFLVPVAIELVGTAGAATALTEATALATLIGVSFIGVSLASSANSKVRIPLTSDPAKALPVPVVPDTATQIPSSSSYKYGASPSFITFAEWVAYVKAANSANANLGTVTYTGQVDYCAGNGSPDTTVVPGYPICASLSFNSSVYGPNTNLAAATPYTKPASCPTGYTVSGSTCILQNALAVTPDGNADFSRTGNTITPPDSADADTIDPNGKVNDLLSRSTITGSGAGVRISGSDAAGNAILFDTTARADGGSTVTIARPVADSSGNTGTQRRVIQVSPRGVVESAQQQTTNDQVVVASPAANVPASVPANAPNASPRQPAPITVIVPAGSGAPVYDPASPTNPATSPLPAPSGSPLGNTGAAAQAITFPNDYARAGEAQASTAPLRDTSTVGDPAVPVAADMPTFGKTFNNLLSWQLPAHSSTCPSLAFDLTMMKLGTFTMDSHCTLIQGKTAEFQLAMGIVWTLLAMMIVLRA